MGRMRIKKKEAVLPFRETLAYRMILLVASMLVFIVSFYVMLGAMQSNMVTFIASAVVLLASVIAVFYNLHHLSRAKVPKQTLNKMKRR